ncbi:MAG: hypothetical protein R2783_08905 [Gelidibacter sp.]
MKRLLILLPFFALMSSCNTSDDAMQQPSETDNFYALTVGNSWVYKNYKYNINTQVYDDTGVIDSISIVSTQDFDGETFYKFRRWTTGNEAGITFCNENGEHFEYFRDSLGYLIRNDGSIKFTNNDYSERILVQNSGISIIEMLVNGTTEITVEAGSFDCIHSERFVRDDANGNQLPALDKFYYSNGIGLIYDTSSFSTQSIPTIIRRLDSYEVQ